MSNNQLLLYVKKLLKNKLICFLLIGGLNTLFGYSVYVLFLVLSLHYTLATLFATILGILFNFKTYGIFVFNNKSNYLIFRFVLVYFFIYFCNNIFICCLEIGRINPYISGAIWLIPGVILTYFLNNRFVYKENKSDNGVS